MNFSPRGSLGLVLSGGGSLGAWQAGFLEGLVRAGLRFEDILGFSIGSLNGAGYCLGKMEVLLSIWKDIDRSRILRFQPRLFPLSLYSNEAIAEVVTHGGNDEEAQKRARCRFTIVSTDALDQSKLYARFSPNGESGWDGPIASHLMASCSIPQVFPPVRISVGGKKRDLVDGGAWVSERISFEALAACRDVIVVQMTRPDEIGRKPGFGYLARKEQDVREKLWDLVDTGISPLLSLPSPPRIFKIHPSRRLDYSMLAFRSSFCRPAVTLGRGDAESWLISPEKFLLK